MAEYTVGLIVGSVSEPSLNRRFADALVRLTPETGLVVRDIPIAELPFYGAQYDKDFPTVGRAFKDAIEKVDGLLIVTPEYNHGVPGAFKNAVDLLGPEWVGKAIGFVSYGSAEGVRAVEQWRQIVANFSMFDVRAQASLSNFTEFAPDGTVVPGPRRAGDLNGLLNQLIGAAEKL